MELDEKLAWQNHLANKETVKSVAANIIFFEVTSCILVQKHTSCTLLKQKIMCVNALETSTNIHTA